MNSLDDFWRAMFGEGISNFEEMLMMRGAWVMTPEEPLYSVFAMMVRVLYESQGEAEKALLTFAPELTDRAQSMIRAFSHRIESGRDSQAIADVIHDSGWMEASMDGQITVDGSTVAGADRG